MKKLIYFIGLVVMFVLGLVTNNAMAKTAQPTFVNMQGDTYLTGWCTTGEVPQVDTHQAAGIIYCPLDDGK